MSSMFAEPPLCKARHAGAGTALTMWENRVSVRATSMRSAMYSSERGLDVAHQLDGNSSLVIWTISPSSGATSRVGRKMTVPSMSRVALGTDRGHTAPHAPADKRSGERACLLFADRYGYLAPRLRARSSFPALALIGRGQRVPGSVRYVSFSPAPGF